VSEEVGDAHAGAPKPPAERGRRGQLVEIAARIPLVNVKRKPILRLQVQERRRVGKVRRFGGPQRQLGDEGPIPIFTQPPLCFPTVKMPAAAEQPSLSTTFRDRICRATSRAYSALSRTAT